MREFVANLAIAKIRSQARELDVPPPRAVASMLGSTQKRDKLTQTP
jgi:hypothetical protein